MKALKSLIVLAGILFLQNGQCQILASYSGTSTPLTASVPAVNTIPLSRGPGLTEQSGNNFYDSKRWTDQNSIDLIDYIEWQVGANTDFNLNLNEISIAYTAGNKAPRTIELRVSQDNFNSFNVIFITSIPQNDEGVFTSSMNVTVASGTSLTFRLYGYNSTNSNSSRFGINGSLGSILGLPNTGITVSGTITYDGLYYDGTTWIPNAPDNSTGSENAFVSSGNPVLNDNASVNNLIISEGSNLSIQEGSGLIVNGNLIAEGVLELNSVSNTYSSLIVNGNSTGEITYFRHVNQFAASGTSTGNNDLISAPLTSASLNFLAFRNSNPDLPSGTINGVPSFLFGPFDNNSNAYINYTVDNDSDMVIAGLGYRTASTVAGGSTFRFDGEVLTEDVPVGISIGTGSIFNLIGNPYPSYLSLSAFLAENNSKFNSFASGVYGYDGDATDGFEIWNQAYADANPEAIIAPGQGFLVTSGQSMETINFLISMRTTGSTDDFIPGRVSSPETFIKHIKLKLEQSTNVFYTDLYFTDNASLGLDPGYDSALLNEVSDFGLYSQLVDGGMTNPLGIQSLNFDAYLNDISVPLGVNGSASQQLVISIDQSTLPDGIEVFLEDRISNSFTRLSTEDYIMTPNSNLNGIGRYYLTFSSQQLGLDSPKTNEIKISVSSNPKTIIIDEFLEANTIIQVFDLQGRLINTSKLALDTTKYTLDATEFNSGVYIIKVLNQNRTKTQKVILK